jgi:hypothetical protein
MTVGKSSCDINGFTQAHIQAAVEQVASLGGGEVELSDGVFLMADALHLRTGVKVKGQGMTTVLKKNAMKTARIISYLGYGHYDLELDQPDLFEVGEGVVIRDNNAFGFYTTVATLIRREGDVWFTNRPHSHDYLGSNGGLVETLFPIIEAVDIEDAAVEGIRIEGNTRANPVPLNGCRGGGFLALRCRRLGVRNLTVRDYNGDGIAFQTCDDMVLSDCVVEGCSGNGFHPGSGSNRFIMKRCSARGNGACGIFYCMRVRQGVLQDSLFENNGSHGLSIGERDIHNLNRNLIIRGNGGAGIWFRNCIRANAAHYNVFEKCEVYGNCQKPGVAEAEIVLQGETEGTRFTGNHIRRLKGQPAILIKKEVIQYEAQGNLIVPSGRMIVQDERPGVSRIKDKQSGGGQRDRKRQAAGVKG